MCVFIVDSRRVSACAAVAQATLSGMSGVYLEWQLKRGDLAFSLWDRNVQLAMFSLPGAIIALCSDAVERAAVQKEGMLHDFSAWTVLVILLTALGGLLVAAAVQYTDNVLKNFAVSVSILITALASGLLFQDLVVDVTFACGTVIVVLAIFIYNGDASSHPQLTGDDKKISSGQMHQCIEAGTVTRPVNLDRPSEHIITNDFSSQPLLEQDMENLPP